jgi:O-methyltransferase
MSSDWIKLMVIQSILRTNMLNLSRIVNLMHLINTVPRGHVMAEFGVYVGNTAVLMAMQSEEPLWLYDSFEGLPEPAEPDAGRSKHFEKGKLKANIKDVMTNFRVFGKPRPRIVKTWFEQIKEKDLPPKFSFVHLDADFYSGTLAVMERVYPRMACGGIIVIDDYGWPGLPGVKKAVDDYMANRQERVYTLDVGPECGQAMIMKEFPANSA